MLKFAIMCAAVALAAVPAEAQAPKVKIDFTQKLIGVGGKPLLQGGDDCKTGQVPGRDCPQIPITLGEAAVWALETPLAEDGPDPLKKFARDQLARKIYGNEGAELSVDEIATIKDRIGRAWGAPQVGAAWPLLDPTLKN